MYGDDHPPDDVRDIFHDLRERWRARWQSWMSASPTEWGRPVRWGAAVLSAATGLVLAWSIWWLAGLPVWATLKKDLDVEQRALDRSHDAARRLPDLMVRLRDAEAETIAWRRLLPIAAPLSMDDDATPPRGSTQRSTSASTAWPSAHASDGAASVGTPGGTGLPVAVDVMNMVDASGTADGDDEVHAAWRGDIERLVVRAGLVLEFARPGPPETSGELEIERAEIRVRGNVANLLGWLAEIDGLPRHLAVGQMSLQGPRMGAGPRGAGGGVDPDNIDATLTVLVSAYRWRQSVDPLHSGDLLAASAWPTLPEPPSRWRMPADTIDVFRTPLTRRAAQDAGDNG